MTSVEIDADRLEYFEEGNADALVLVHGSASDHRTWSRQKNEFAKRFRVITYSRRYHWPNEPIRDGVDYAMAQHVDDLQALLSALDAAPAHLAGHSYGALVCLLVAMRAPHLVRKLVLAEPPAITLFVSTVPKPLEVIRLLATRPRTAAAIIKFGAKGVVPASKALRQGESERAARIFGDAVLGPGGFDRMPDARKAQVHDNLTNIEAELLGSGFLPLDADRIRGVRAPTLLVTGQKSVGLFHRLTDRLEELLPHSTRIEIPGATHMMHEENPAAYNAAVLSFLRN